MDPISPDEYNKIYDSTGLDVDGRLARVQKMRPFIDVIIRNLVTFAKQIPHFKDLIMEDQSNLLKGQ